MEVHEFSRQVPAFQPDWLDGHKDVLLLPTRMKCPFCKIDNDKVIDSRSAEDGFLVRRRRHCLNCDNRFSTLERVVEIDVRVAKKDGAREPFRPEKIKLGLERACWKRPIRTVELESIYNLSLIHI